MADSDKDSKNNRYRGLIPWKKGMPSPNPAGRPKKKLPSETLAEMLEAEFGGNIKALQQTMPEPWRSAKEITVQDAVVWIMLRKSLTGPGDLARKEVFDRREGKPLQKIAGPTGEPVSVQLDLKQFSDKELKQLRELRAKLEKKK